MTTKPDTAVSIDALLRRLAPHVKGLATKCPCDPAKYQCPYCRERIEARGTNHSPYCMNDCHGFGLLLPPLADAAMKCLEWMMERVYGGVTISLRVRNKYAILSKTTIGTELLGYAPTLPEAIVRAAAKVAGVTEEQHE